MKEELRKNLTDLIDETLLELEELKKSRFAASEIDLKGPGEGIAGKPTNGDLHAKAEDKDDEDEDEDAEKAEGTNRQSDPDGGKHKPVGGEGMKDTHGRHSESPNSSVTHGQGKNSESDPGNIHWAMKSEGDEGHMKKDEDEDEDEKDKDAKGGEHHEKEEKKAIKKLSSLAGMKKGDTPSPEKVDHDVQKLVMHGLKKSQEETEELLKSFVEERIAPLEDKLSTILDLVNRIAEQPVPAKGTTANAVPLRKSNEEGYEELSKAEVASKLFELKKSGTKVDSLDITKAEMGQDLAKITAKYKIS
jgi:hypothetical protein